MDWPITALRTALFDGRPMATYSALGEIPLTVSAASTARALSRTGFTQNPLRAK